MSENFRGEIFLTHTVGSYSDSAGVEVVRHHAADYIARRDGGIEANYKDIFLSSGASDAIKVRTVYSR